MNNIQDTCFRNTTNTLQSNYIAKIGVKATLELFISDFHSARNNEFV